MSVGVLLWWLVILDSRCWPTRMISDITTRCVSKCEDTEYFCFKKLHKTNMSGGNFPRLKHVWHTSLDLCVYAGQKCYLNNQFILFIILLQGWRLCECYSKCLEQRKTLPDAPLTWEIHILTHSFLHNLLWHLNSFLISVIVRPFWYSLALTLERSS